LGCSFPLNIWYFIGNFRSISIFQEPEYFRVERILGILGILSRAEKKNP
jgi:hypothetical protein